MRADRGRTLGKDTIMNEGLSNFVKINISLEFCSVTMVSMVLMGQKQNVFPFNLPKIVI